MQFLDKDTWWYLGSGGTKFGQDVGTNIVVVYDVLDFQSGEFVFQFAYFSDVIIHSFIGSIPFLVDLLDD